MIRRRIFSLFLALVLLAGVLPPARCAGQAAVVCETGEKDGAISLRLEGLDGSAVYGVQLELVLTGEYDCGFTSSSQTAYSPDCQVKTEAGKTTVTIYLTDRAVMNQGTELDLGELDLGTKAGLSVLPDTAKVILLDHNLRPTNSTVTVDGGTPEPPQNPDDPVTPIFPVIPGGNTGTVRPSDTTKPDDTKKPGDTEEDKTEEPGGPGNQEEPQQPANPTPVVLPFVDVAKTDWFYSAVEYVYAHSIMSGTDEKVFSPGQNATRGMIVTMLHRLENSPSAQPAAFRDVAAGAYYAGPVAWASANGIVNGSGDGLFSPENFITREQMAAILYRYAQYKGLDVTLKGSLSAFPDASAVSSYATDAMSWAVGTGLINGTDGKLDPAGNATRAQIATIFQRLCTKLLEMA